MEGIAPYSFGAGGDACLLRGGDANGSLPQPYWGAHQGSDARGHRHSHNGGGGGHAIFWAYCRADLYALTTTDPGADTGSDIPLVSAGGVNAISEEQANREIKQSALSDFFWETDFRFRTVPYAEILSGGPGKDGIRAIAKPAFRSVQAPDQLLVDREPVQVVNINGDARAYPVRIMMHHELVNDTVGGDPVVITF